MNNWRLLLALVAIFQPITSFTERGLVNGRHQCCDRQSRYLLQDKPLSHGPNRIKTASPEYRLNQRDEIREDRRQEINLYDSDSNRPSTDIRLQRTQERRIQASPTAKSARANYHNNLERFAPQTVRNSRASKEQSRRFNSVSSYVKAADVVHEGQSRDITRTTRFDDERLSRTFLNTRHETRRLEIRSQELRKSMPNREANNEFTGRRTRSNVARVQGYGVDRLMNQQRIDRARMNLRHEPSARNDMRRKMIERRISERRTDAVVNRRLSSDKAEILDMRLSLTSRHENRENHRVEANRRLGLKKIDVHQEQREDNIVFRDRTNVARSVSRDVRISNVQSEVRRFVEQDNNQRKVRDVRRTRDSRDVRINQSDERRFIERDENPRELRNDVRRSRDSGNARNNGLRSNERQSVERDGDRRGVSHDTRRVRDSRDARISTIRSNDRRSIELDENRRALRDSRQIREGRRTRTNEVRSNEWRSVERDINRREVRVDIRRIRDGRDANGIRSNARRSVERDEHGREMRPDIRRVRDSRDAMISIQSNERRSIELENSREVRFDIRLFQHNKDVRLNGDRSNERRSIESDVDRRETRDEIRTVRDSRDAGISRVLSNERRSVERNGYRGEVRDDIRRVRESRSARIHEIRNDERRSNENDANRKEIRDDIRKVRDSRDVRINEIRTDKRRYITRDDTRRARDARIIAVQRDERRSVESSDRNRRDLRDTTRLVRDIRDATTNGVRSVERRSRIISDTEIRNDMRLSRDSRHERLARIGSEQRHSEPTDHTRRFRESRDARIIVSRADERRVHEKRATNIREDRNERIRENQREVRNDVKRVRESRDEKTSNNGILDSRRTINRELERDSVTNRRARSMDLENHLFAEARRQKFAEGSMERNSRIHVKSHDNVMEREAVTARIETEPMRNREIISPEQKIAENENVLANWQYVFYALQSVYLCGLFMQLLSPDGEKLKTRKWWPLSSQRLIKAD